MEANDCIFKNQSGYPIGLDIAKCAQWIEESLHIATMVPCRKHETMLYYKDGVYVEGADKLIRYILEQAFGNRKNSEGKELLNIRRKDEIMDKVASRTYKETYQQLSPIKVPTFDGNLDVINMCNGLYNWRTGEFREHDPNYLSRIQVAVSYDQNADCSTLMEIIKDVLKASDVDKFIEALAYNFYRCYRDIQKAFVLLGEGATGKTQLLAIPKNMVGNWNTTSVTLQMLGGVIPDPYAVAELDGKLVNIVGDMDRTLIKESGNFKMLTSGEDQVKARRIYGAPFYVENFAKCWMSCNEMPVFGDRSDAIDRRLEIFECLNKFASSGEKFDRLYALSDPDELSGLFNVCMEKLPDLLERKQFTNTTTIDQARKIRLRSSNTVDMFLNECVEDDEGSYISKSAMFDAYRSYCKAHRLAKVGDKISFGRELKKAEFKAQDGFRTYDNKRVRCWLDVRVKMP